MKGIASWLGLSSAFGVNMFDRISKGRTQKDYNKHTVDEIQSENKRIAEHNSMIDAKKKAKLLRRQQGGAK